MMAASSQQPSLRLTCHRLAVRSRSHTFRVWIPIRTMDALHPLFHGVCAMPFSSVSVDLPLPHGSRVADGARKINVHPVAGLSMAACV